MFFFCGTKKNQAIFINHSVFIMKKIEFTLEINEF